MRLVKDRPEALGRDVGTGLLVQPPRGQPEFGAYSVRFLEHDAVRLEHRIDIPGGPARVISQCHRGTAEHVDVSDYAALGKPVAQAPEDLLHPRTVEQRTAAAHAASIS